MVRVHVSGGRAAALLALFACVGCTGETVTGPALELTPTELVFEEIPVFTEDSRSFAVRNAGSTTFEVLSTTLIEGSTAAWRLDRPEDAELESGETFTVVVTYTPIEEGAATGRIQVRTTFDDEPTHYVDLAGTAGPSVRDDDGDGWTAADGDCNDDNDTVFPGATEVCDGEDTDCDGVLEEEEADADYDGWLICEGDCDDEDERVYPGAAEICDDKDSDCDDFIPDREDADGDGFTPCDGDCDDDEPLAMPTLEEVCDSIDNDCSGEVDDIDEDGDGHSPCLGGGDCDDQDRDAHPVVVDLEAEDGGDGTISRPYNDLTEALENRDDVCRTIVLSPGSYELSTAHDDGYLRFVGGGLDADDVVIVPSKKESRIFEVSSGATLSLENMTLTGADAPGDGGAVRAVAADLELYGVVFEANRCTGDGGAVAVSSGSLTSLDTIFRDNHSDDDGGALAVLSGAYTDDGSLFQGNEGVRGGAAALESTDISATGVTWSENEADDVGGALAVIGGTLALEGCRFTLNHSSLDGGALSASDLTREGSVLRNLVFQDNIAQKAGGAVAFGGSEVAAVLANSTFTANAAADEGAGIYVAAAEATELWVWSNALLWSDGESGLWAAPGCGASFAYNHAYLTTSGTDFDLGDADGGDNVVEDPQLTDVSNDGDPDNDDLAPGATSPLIDSGPPDGSGPAGYSWRDTDGTRNDRGHTGGPGEWE